MYADQGDLKSM